MEKHGGREAQGEGGVVEKSMWSLVTRHLSPEVGGRREKKGGRREERGEKREEGGGRMMGGISPAECLLRGSRRQIHVMAILSVQTAAD